MLDGTRLIVHHVLETDEEDTADERELHSVTTRAGKFFGQHFKGLGVLRQGMLAVFADHGEIMRAGGGG